MPKKKKHPRLPNGLGSIRYVSGGRTRPYAVHPPAIRQHGGGYKRSPAICYVSSWNAGLAVLMAYKAGTYTPGMEIEYEQMDDQNLNGLAKKIFADYSVIRGTPNGITFAEAYERYAEWKFGAGAPKKFTAGTKKDTYLTFKRLEKIHGSKLDDLTVDDLQNVLIELNVMQETTNKNTALIKNVYKFAYSRGLCSKDSGMYVVAPAGKESRHYEPFSDKELAILWKHSDMYDITVLLIMCYSGFRIGALIDLEVDLNARTLFGGNKTDAGKNNLVPIHSAIYPLVKRDIKQYGKIFKYGSVDTFRKKIPKILCELGIQGKTSHSCKHTFSRLCEHYEVSFYDQKRMMGHKISDMTRGTYGHRSIEDLRRELEKIKVPKY